MFTLTRTDSHETATCVRCQESKTFPRGGPHRVRWQSAHKCRPVTSGEAA